VRYAVLLVGCAHAAFAAPQPRDPAAIAHDVLVAHVPRLHVFPATKIDEIHDPVLAAHFPRLRFFRGEHLTDYYEYMDTTSLVVVRDDGQERHDIFGSGIDPVFELLEGATIKDAADAAAVTAAIGALVGPVAEEGHYEKHDPFQGSEPFGLAGERAWQIELGGQGDPHLVLLISGDALMLVQIEPGEAQHIEDATLDRPLAGPFATLAEACAKSSDNCDQPIFEKVPVMPFRTVAVLWKTTDETCDLVVEDRDLKWWTLDGIAPRCDWESWFDVKATTNRVAIEMQKERELVCGVTDRPTCGAIPWKR
jgi:hypothetical protein